ncbi:MAG: arginyltransferase [Nitratireductor sp.]|nr:arginyltransferase [Nitratireductor sp.]MCB1454864.1 arginyltransferase [Nitratireductor sp.]MCB1459333.1 arginyltransferase [Nitratireductor sp.]
MTRIAIDTPQFYLTAPATCPYLDGKLERKVFTHLVGERAPEINDMLTQGGFRRSQNIAYRPACEDCRACVSVRIVVDEFRVGSSLKRTWRNNRDLVGKQGGAAATSEQYSLFRQYLDSRHAGGGMADMSALDYAMMVEDTHVNTMMIEYRKRGPDTGITGAGAGPLVGVALTDILVNGLSMVYSFFDTDLDGRSLGTYMILDHVERARKMGLPYVYLGYWVRGSRKMEYKTRFQPQEHLTMTGWERKSPD